MQNKLFKPPQKIFLNEKAAQSLKSFLNKNCGYLLAIIIFALLPFVPIVIVTLNTYNLSSFAKIFIAWTNIWDTDFQSLNDYTYQYFKAITPILYLAVLRFIFIFNSNPYFVISYIISPLLAISLCGTSFLLFKYIYGKNLYALACGILVLVSASLEGTILEGSPKAFSLPFLMTFFCFLLSRNKLGIVISLMITVSFYPPLGLFCLIVFVFNNVKFKENILARKQPQDYFLLLTMLAVFLFFSYFHYYRILNFGNVAFMHQAKKIAIFNQGHLFEFFTKDIMSYLFLNSNSSLLRGLGKEYGTSAAVFILVLFIAINIISSCFLLKHSLLLPESAIILHNIFKSVIVTYIISGLYVFKLYVPAAVSGIVLTIITPIAAMLIIAKKLDDINFLNKKTLLIITSTIFILITASLLTINGYKNSQTRIFATDEEQVIDFIKNNTNKNDIIAGLPSITTSIEALTARKTIGARHHLIPFNRNYYSKIYYDIDEFIKILFSEKKAPIDIFIAKENVAYFLIEKDFNDVKRWATSQNWWINEFRPNIKENNNYVFFQYIASCKVFENDSFIMIDAKCFLQSKEHNVARPNKTPRRRTPFIPD